MSVCLAPRLNEIIKDLGLGLMYSVAEIAPSSYAELKAQAVGGLVVYAGASDRTIYGDPSVNWLFRAIHDHMHDRLNLDFSATSEIELGRLTAAMPVFQGQLADIVYAEIAGQVEYFHETGDFPIDQIKFIRRYLTI